jgi:hypothetical protein
MKIWGFWFWVWTSSSHSTGTRTVVAFGILLMNDDSGLIFDPWFFWVTVRWQQKYIMSAVLFVHNE